MMRRLHFAFLVVLITAGCTSSFGVQPGSVSGVVRDSAGVPQIGAEVQLLRSDLSVVATVYTNASGRFAISTLAPGRYSIKAMGTSFLPSLRENVRIRANTIVNLTLNTLYEVMQWLPAEPRNGNAQKDDWAWTLRSAANRPLLRWLEDGPLVVVSDGSGTRPRLKARLLASGQAGSFGEGGERFSAMVENTPSDSRELLARVDFASNSDQALESMLGFRQDLGFAGSVQSVAAVAIHPEVSTFGAEGLDEVADRSWETMNLGDEFEAEVGAEQVVAHFSSHSPNVVAAALPFATLGWRDGNSAVRYRIATVLPRDEGASDSEAQTWLPNVAMRDGELKLEHGLHQEIGWERRTDGSGLTVLAYSESVANPVVEAAADSATANPDAQSALFDRSTNLLRTAGPDYSSVGVLASVDHRLPGGNHVRLSYANGNALVMSAASAGASGAAQAVAGARPRRTQMYSLSLSGTLDGSRTRWRASYRWQPAETVTRVAPYALDAAEPFFNLYVRQPLCMHRDGTGRIEALVDVRNLLAQGYRPVLLSDGSVLVFAQDQRSIRAGLAFTF